MEAGRRWLRLGRRGSDHLPGTPPLSSGSSSDGSGVCSDGSGAPAPQPRARARRSMPRPAPAADGAAAGGGEEAEAAAAEEEEGDELEEEQRQQEDEEGEGAAPKRAGAGRRAAAAAAAGGGGGGGGGAAPGEELVVGDRAAYARTGEWDGDGSGGSGSDAGGGSGGGSDAGGEALEDGLGTAAPAGEEEDAALVVGGGRMEEAEAEEAEAQEAEAEEAAEEEAEGSSAEEEEEESSEDDDDDDDEEEEEEEEEEGEEGEAADGDWEALDAALGGGEEEEEDEDEDAEEDADEEEEEDEQEEEEEVSGETDEEEAGLPLLDRAASAQHAYLGDCDELRGGFGWLEEGRDIELPLLTLWGVVLFPGEMLPLRLDLQEQRHVLARALAAPPPARRLVFVAGAAGVGAEGGVHGCSLFNRSAVGCTAEIRSIGRVQEDGAVAVMALGRQRAAMLPPRRGVGGGGGGRGGRGGAPPWRPGFVPLGTRAARVRVIGEGCRAPPPREYALHAAAWGPSEARAFDIRALAAAVAGALRLVLPPPLAARAPAGGLELSYWAAVNLPLEPALRQALLEAPHAAGRLRLLAALLARADRVACAGCGSLVAALRDLFNSSGDGSGGAFVNPHGHVHDMATFGRVAAGNVGLQGRPTTEWSWYPGYSWQICNCTGCGEHLGCGSRGPAAARRGRSRSRARLGAGISILSLARQRRGRWSILRPPAAGGGGGGGGG
ncbi:MAG: hypothetical protein J3K34DRAFT_459827, partial [Monoraphidium minutum]